MAVPTLLHVTQVAPYRDGPAGVHGVLDQSAAAVAELAESAGLVPRRVHDVRELDVADLAAARAVSLFTIGETPWSPEQRAALTEGLRSGRTALVAIHSATDACYGWDGYGSLVGARFDGHPWTQTVTLDVTDRSHPAVAHLGPTWRWHDEVYRFRDLRPDARVLLAAGGDPPRARARDQQADMLGDRPERQGREHGHGQEEDRDQLPPGIGVHDAEARDHAEDCPQQHHDNQVVVVGQGHLGGLRRRDLRVPNLCRPPEPASRR